MELVAIRGREREEDGRSRSSGEEDHYVTSPFGDDNQYAIREEVKKGRKDAMIVPGRRGQGEKCNFGWVNAPIYIL